MLLLPLDDVDDAVAIVNWKERKYMHLVYSLLYVYWVKTVSERVEVALDHLGWPLWWRGDDDGDDKDDACCCCCRSRKMMCGCVGVCECVLMGWAIVWWRLEWVYVYFLFPIISHWDDDMKNYHTYAYIGMVFFAFYSPSSLHHLATSHSTIPFIFSVFHRFYNNSTISRWRRADINSQPIGGGDFFLI